MDRGYIKKKHVKVLALLSILLLILSIYVHSTENFAVYRGLRGAICFSFLTVLFFYRKKKVNVIVIAFLLLYGISSFVTIWYENSLWAIISMALNVIAFLVLIRALWPKISFKKMTALFAIFSGLLLLVNVYLLYIFVEMMRGFTSGNLHYVFIMIGSMSLVVTGFFSLLYNHKFSSRASLIFTLFVVALVFAEVFRAIGYYDFAYGNFSVYIARALLLLGCALLAHYELMDKKPTEVLGKK